MKLLWTIKVYEHETSIKPRHFKVQIEGAPEVGNLGRRSFGVAKGATAQKAYLSACAQLIFKPPFDMRPERAAAEHSPAKEKP